MKQVRLIITGMVQGVGFRYFVKETAEKLQLFGWVRNLSSGSVEALIQGESSDINKFIELCRQGSYLATVKDIKVSEEGITDKYQSFDIKPTV